MIQAVSIVFRHKEEVYLIKRQENLRDFPGYSAFVGGKVEKEDFKESINPLFPYIEDQIELLNCLVREVKEEVLYDLTHSQNILSIKKIATTYSPQFIPKRMHISYFLIELKEKVDFKFSPHEIVQAQWINPILAMKQWENCERLMVPPTQKILKAMGSHQAIDYCLDLSLSSPEDKTPIVGPLNGLFQILPFSNTLPPAEITNCFVLGTEKNGYFVVDPSPRDEFEYLKLKKRLHDFKLNFIFITHHHPDHHERAVQLSKELNIPIKMSNLTKKWIVEKFGEDYLKNSQLKTIIDGEILFDCVDYKLLAMSIPGHDSGQMAIHRDDFKWMIVGDLFQGIGSVVIANPEGDMNMYFRTLEKIIKISPNVIIPSHGIALGGVHYLKNLLKHRLEREKKIYETQKDGNSLEEILEIVYGPLPQALKPYAMKNIITHLEKIKKHGIG
ncbi:MAG: MBL fold metallo-hydrolase [Halobacteriovoraceae bacterium]|nr:MBL fold metallo-hydrolase [Halobacteriovoraceae bacterium]